MSESVASQVERLRGLVFYAVMNGDGQFFRRKGYQGCGDTWVDDPLQARIYNRISPARACVSFFANHYPKFPTPYLVEIRPGEVVVVDEKERVAAVKRDKKRAEGLREVYRRKREVASAQEALEAAKKKLGELGVL